MQKIVTCTRRIQFCAGHRVHRHESKCRNLHGHNYVALFTARAPELDQLGRVIDFSVLKEILGGWVDRFWDHGFILWERDTEMVNLLQSVPGQKLHLLPDNPTAENMAKYLLERVCPEVLKDTPVTITHVRLWETENCYSDAEAV